jgi:hypothetical protein
MKKNLWGEDTVNVAFQGYANNNRNLAPGTQLQVVMDENPVTITPPIIELQNSGTKDFVIPGTPYTVTLAFNYVPWNIMSPTISAHYDVGIKKIVNNNATYEPVPAAFPIPVYVATNIEIVDNNKFEIKLTGKQYAYPESFRKIESFEGKDFNLNFEGYADPSLNLDPGTQLQIFVNGNLVTSDQPITTLQNSGIKPVNVKTADGQFYTVTVAYKYTPVPYLGLFGGNNYYAVGIKDVKPNTELKNLEESRIEEEGILKTNFKFPVYIKPSEVSAEGIQFKLEIDGFKLIPQIVPTTSDGFTFAGFADDKGNIYGNGKLILTASNGEKFPLGEYSHHFYIKNISDYSK